MFYLYHLFLYQPLVNILVLLYNTIAFQDLGLSIIILTVGIRFLLYPLFQKILRQQTVLQKIKPEIDRIEQEHKGDLEKKGRAQMALYKEHKVNPFSIFFVLFLQLLILIPLFHIFQGAPTTLDSKELYIFITAPSQFNSTFLGLINLQSQSIILIVIASILQFLQTRLSVAAQKNSNSAGQSMVFVGPLIIIFFLWSSPSAIWLYLLVSNLFSLVQQLIVNRQLAISPKKV
ncbi:MAG: YidC/Oxa1 family membrane protein insertase [Patescibacteria group bacterium]